MNNWPIGTVKLKAGDYLVKVHITDLGKRIEFKFPFNRRLLAEIKAMQGRKWHPDEKVWSASKSDRNLFQLRFLMGENVYAIYDKPLEVFEPNRSVLMAHQGQMLNHILTRKRSVIAGDMGVGKTLSALEAVELVNPEVCWYIAPKSAKISVELEFAKWQSKIWPEFLTYDKVKSRLANWSPSQKAPRFVVFDESSKLKNPGTQRWQVMEHLVNAMREDWGDDFYVLLMTGTPAPHDPSDWWGQVELACAGFLREGSKRDLLRRIAVIETCETLSGSTYPKLTGYKHAEIDLLSKRLEGIVLVVRKKDCLDLPEKIYQQIILRPADDTLRAAYLVAQTAKNAAVAMSKVRQLSDGFLYQEDKSVALGDTPKDDALLDLIEDRDRIVIYAGFHASIDRVERLVQTVGWDILKYDGRGFKTTLGLDFKDSLKMFQREGGDNDRKIAYIGHPSSGGMGLTLTASDMIIYYSNDFNGEARQQSEDRIHRIGTRGATIVDIIHLPTDLLVLNNLKAKRDLERVSLGEVLESLRIKDDGTISHS